MGKSHKNPQPPPPAKEDGKSHNHSESPTRTQQLVWLANVVVAVCIVYYMLHRVATKTYTPIFLFESAQQPQLLESFGLFTSFLLTLHTFSADWLDVVFSKTQNDLYRAQTNIVSNTILWSIVLLGAYLYRGDKVLGGTGIDVSLIDMFLVGRILFSIGYTVGAVVGHQSFRSVGFGLGFGSIIIMVTEVLNYSILEHFK